LVFRLLGWIKKTIGGKVCISGTERFNHACPKQLIGKLYSVNEPKVLWGYQCIKRDLVKPSETETETLTSSYGNLLLNLWNGLG
jgi:hypothetical protein